MGKGKKPSRATSTRMKLRSKLHEPLESRCRFCLKHTTTQCLFELPQPATDDVSVLEKVKSILGLELRASDKLPSRICDTCLRLIAETYEFKVRANNSNKRLQRQTLGKNCRPGH